MGEDRESREELGDLGAPSPSRSPQDAQTPSLPPATAHYGSTSKSGLASGFQVHAGAVPSPGPS